MTDPSTTPAVDALSIDAGEVAPEPATVNIGDQVWFDTDGNGLQNDGEPEIPGFVES